MGIHFIKLDVPVVFARDGGGSVAWLGSGGCISNSSAYNIHIYIPCTGCPINLLPGPVGLEPADAIQTNTASRDTRT